MFILVGVWQMFQGNFGNGLWIAFIGWFLESAAVGQVQQQRVHDLLAGRSVSQAMSRGYTSIPADTTLQQLVDRHILETGRRCFLVVQNDEAVGFLTLHHVKEVPRDKWPTTTALQAMTPMMQMKQVAPETELWNALEEMDRDGVNQLPVMTEGQCIGMLSREDLVSYLRTVRELGI